MNAVLKALLFTDLVGSTALAERLGDARWAELNARMDALARELRPNRGELMLERTDGFLMAFDRPVDAVRMALRWHEALESLGAAEGVELRSRAGIHLGEVMLRENPDGARGEGEKPIEMDSLAIAQAARAMSLAGAGQTLLTRGAFDLARRGAVGDDALPAGVRWLAHGRYFFKGVEEPIEVCEAGVEGRAPLAPPPDGEKARRAVSPDEEQVLGWRPAPGARVEARPNWVLEAKLGEGGFGEVWLGRHAKTHEARVFKFCFDAMRLRGLKREVALFRLLREALGDRPDIGRVIDWSFDEPPYFIELDYTPDGSLVQWAEGLEGGLASVPLAERLDLVAQVADGLAAAHSVGILHKDIKPSNMLVYHDEQGRARARLADFGIGGLVDRSALMAQGITDAGFTGTLDQGDSSLTGTRLYLAPELLEGRPPTLQSDLYALGVMLFQLCVGDTRRAMATGWEDEIADDLLVEDIRACVHGDPRRRLRDASELAHRLRRLEDRRAQRQQQAREREEAQAAREALERSRQRRKLAAAAAVAAALFLAAVTILYARAERARGLAEAAGLRAEESAREANAQRGEAEAARAAAERLLAIATDQGDGAFELVGFLLGGLKEAMDEELTADRGVPPEEASAIAHSIAGRIARPILDYFESAPASEVAAWPADLQLARAAQVHAAGVQLRELARYEEASRLLQAALDARGRLLGAGHPDTAATMNSLASLQRQLGRFDEAEALYRRALATAEDTFGPDHPDTSAVLGNLAGLLSITGRHEEAEPLLRRALAIEEEALGVDDARAAATMGNLAELLHRMGRQEEAQALYEETLARQERLVGPDHEDTAMTLSNLAALHADNGRPEEALPLAQRALRARERQLGPDHPSTALSLHNLGLIWLQTARPDEAEALFARALATREQVLGADHPSTRGTRLLLFVARLHVARTASEPRAMAAAALDAAAALPPEDLADDWLQAYFAEALVLAGRLEEARPLAEAVLAEGYLDQEMAPEDAEGFAAACRALGLAVP